MGEGDENRTVAASSRRTLERLRRKLLRGRLAPSSDDPGDSRERIVLAAVRWVTAAAICVANVIGGVLVFVLLAFIIPPPGENEDAVLVNLVIAAVFIGIALPLGILLAMRRQAPSRDWMLAGREPTREEQRNLLRTPLYVLVVVGSFWAVAAILFGTFNSLVYSFELGRQVGIAVLLSGLATCAVAYLQTEWLLRPAAARALAARRLEDPALPGVTFRLLFTWALVSGVPMLGLAIIGLSVLIEPDLSRDQLAVAVLALTGTGLVVGFIATFIAARVTADPILSVRRGVSQVEDGDLDVEIPVYDGSELGLLQSGFNRMVNGLKERERMRDIFGRHVGEDVAREAMERGEDTLGGETREVAILFVDMTGSTEIASTRPATEVVELLNDFFGVVVETVDSHGGWVNKFEGDAALAVYGAPQEIDDPAGRALASAREMAERLGGEVEGAEAGIGVAYGEVVAGNIGGAKRFEYTVIGDAVNEASRLTDLAKEHDGLLASATAVERASEEERGRWSLGDEVELRGRSRKTRLARPS